jgi:hypothetical protein
VRLVCLMRHYCLILTRSRRAPRGCTGKKLVVNATCTPGVHLKWEVDLVPKVGGGGE